MTKAIIIIVLVLLFIIGGMVTLLRSANQKIPDNYDRSKLGFDDEEDDWPATNQNDSKNNETRALATERLGQDEQVKEVQEKEQEEKGKQ